MLRFAGYLVATAGGATGVWTASGAATNAFVGFATNLLETSFQRGSRAALDELSAAGMGAVGPGGARGRRGRRSLHAERARRPLSNAHRHQEGLECLDLATPFPELMEQDSAVKLVSDMMVLLLGCSCLYAASSVVYRWLRLLHDNPLEAATLGNAESAGPRAGAEIEDTGGQETAATREAEDAEQDQAGEEEEGVFSVEVDDGDREGECAESAVRRTPADPAPSPFVDSSGELLVQPLAREGMHNSNLASVSTIRRANSRALPSQRSRRPGINAIRHYFQVESPAAAEAGDAGPDPGLLSTSAPAKSRNVYVPLVDTLGLL
eukprot:jgi/Tetstr1/438205/TSEL_026804.t1